MYSNKKGPDLSGPCMNPILLQSPPQGRCAYFFFLAGAFFFAGALAFLVAFFIVLILPNIRFAICLRRPQCDSYIRCFGMNVK